MKTYLIICLTYSLLFVGTNAFAQEKKESWTQIHWIDTNKIELSLIYEGAIVVEGQEFKSYSLFWNDTIGQSMGYPKSNRPLELKVVVRTKERIVGRYTGLSSLMSHCDFYTNSDWVSVHFWLEQNMFFDINKYGNDPSIRFKNSYNDYWERINFNRKEYKPLRININKINSQNIVDGYDKKEIMLKTNPNLVRLYWINKGALNPDPMPSSVGLATGLRQVIALDRNLLDTETGKIELGKNWLRKRGIANTAEMDFRVIDPHLTYSTKSGTQILGKELIKKKKIDINDFNIGTEFKTIQWSLPYSVNYF